VREPRYRAPSSEEIIDRQFFIKNQRGDVIVNDAGEDLIGAVIDDESIVKQNLGDLKYSAQLSAGIEQLLHPEIGTAVEATGKFWGDPYRRIAVSLPPIMAVVYAENPYAAGNHVRHLHEGVNGTDKNGRHFNTLDRDASIGHTKHFVAVCRKMLSTTVAWNSQTQIENSYSLNQRPGIATMACL
jgi:hypothetical protein